MMSRWTKRRRRRTIRLDDDDKEEEGRHRRHHRLDVERPMADLLSPDEDDDDDIMTTTNGVQVRLGGVPGVTRCEEFLKFDGGYGCTARKKEKTTTRRKTLEKCR